MHPTTLSVWGWYQLTFKTFGPSKSIWYTFIHCYHWAHPIHFVQSPPRARHDLACQLGSSPTHSPAVKHELQVFRPTFGPNMVKSLVPEAVSHPFPPLPVPPPSHNFSWEVFASPIFETDAPTPPGGQGCRITCSHTCLICRSCEKPCSSFLKKSKTFT